MPGAPVNPLMVANRVNELTISGESDPDFKASKYEKEAAFVSIVDIRAAHPIDEDQDDSLVVTQVNRTEVGTMTDNYFYLIVDEAEQFGQANIVGSIP